VNATLYTYRCSNCHTVAITDIKPFANRPERCACGSWLRLLYTSPMTEAAAALLKTKAMVFNPYAEPVKPTPCARCDGPISYMTARRRPDGYVCGGCYAAEEHPAVKKITEDDIAAAHMAHKERERQIRQFEREQDALNQGVTSSTGE
jgi:hypothetical protein